MEDRRKNQSNRTRAIKRRREKGGRVSGRRSPPSVRAARALSALSFRLFVFFLFYFVLPSQGDISDVARIPRPCAVLFRSFVCQIFIERFSARPPTYGASSAIARNKKRIKKRGEKCGGEGVSREDGSTVGGKGWERKSDRRPITKGSSCVRVRLSERANKIIGDAAPG